MKKLNGKQRIDYYHDFQRNRRCSICDSDEQTLEVYDLDHDEKLDICRSCSNTEVIFEHHGKFIISDHED